MCTDEIYTWTSCNKVEIKHKICLAHIAHTHRQLDVSPCPKLHNVRRISDDKTCNCKFSSRRCKQGTWAVKGDGNHSWIFEEDRKAKKKWPVKEDLEAEWEDEDVSPKTKGGSGRGRGGKRIKREEGGYERAASYENPPPVEELDRDLAKYERARRAKLKGKDKEDRDREVKVKEEPVSEEEMIS